MIYLRRSKLMDLVLVFEFILDLSAKLRDLET